MTFAEFAALVGEELGVSDWVAVDQARIDAFADCTGDRQWIHVDPEMARRRSPFRTTIAHGYLTLSLIGGLALQVLDRSGGLPDLQGAFLHGVDNVRFLSAVRAGSRVRLRSRMAAFDLESPGKYLLRTANTIEIENEPAPALTADVLTILYERRRRPSGPA